MRWMPLPPQLEQIAITQPGTPFQCGIARRHDPETFLKNPGLEAVLQQLRPLLQMLLQLRCRQRRSLRHQIQRRGQTTQHLLGSQTLLLQRFQPLGLLTLGQLLACGITEQRHMPVTRRALANTAITAC